MPQPVEVRNRQQPFLLDVRHVQGEIDAWEAALLSNPQLETSMIRMRRHERTITRSLTRLQIQATLWVNEEIPAIYELGGRSVDPDYDRTDDEADVGFQRRELLGTLVAAIAFVRLDIRRFIRKLSSANIEHGVIGSNDGLEARVIDLVENEGVHAVRYANGHRYSLYDYVEMLVQTRSAEVYNRGTLNAGVVRQQPWFVVADGEGCGWRSHRDPDTANGKVVAYDHAMSQLLAHPRCQRSFSPLVV